MHYQEYKNLLMELAHGFSRRPEEFEDMMGVAHCAFLKARNSFDPRRGSFCTHLYRVTKNAMIDEVRKDSKHKNHFSYDALTDENESDQVHPVVPYDDRSNAERRTMFKQILESLSPDSRQVVSVILSAPDELFTGTKSLAPKYMRGQLIRLLRARNWKWNAIYDSIKEIKNAIRETKTDHG